MTSPSVVPICIGGLVLLVVAYMGYRLVRFALRTKGDVNVEMSRGKTVFKLEAKERSASR